MFRLGNSRSACCDWDLCNLSWETAQLTEAEWEAQEVAKQWEAGGTVAAAVAGGIAAIFWCCAFAYLIYRYI